MQFGKELIELRDLLADLYPSRRDAEQLLDEAQISRRHINFGESAVDIWHSILTETERQEQTAAIFPAARKRYPRHQRLATAVAAYEAWVERARSSRQEQSSWEATNATPGASATQSDRRWLREALTQNFSDEELQTLCFDLGIDYDNLPGQGKAAKARELVQFCERHNRTPELLDHLHLARPHLIRNRGADSAPRPPPQDSQGNVADLLKTLKAIDQRIAALEAQDSTQAQEEMVGLKAKGRTVITQIENSGVAPPEVAEPLPTIWPHNAGNARNVWAVEVARVTPEQRGQLDLMLDSRRSLQERAKAGRKLAEMGDPRLGVGLGADGVPDIVWVELAEGNFVVGGDEDADQSLPARQVTLAKFWLARYPVTNRQWEAFQHAADGYVKEQWWQGLAEGRQKPLSSGWSYWNHPRESVNWYEAVAYCRWLSYKLKQEIRLPTEEEWERAARGAAGRYYPWGNEYVSGYANLDETWKSANVGPHNLGYTSAVGMYPQGATPEGICDLSGNVWEWTATEWEGGTNLTAPTQRVLRGGSWYDFHWLARASSRQRLNPLERGKSRGFRVASSTRPRL